MPKEEAAWKNVRREERRCWRVQKQFRAVPCKFFGADNKTCANGDKCAFSHIYKGWDYHAGAWASDEAERDRKASAPVSAGETSPTADSRSAVSTPPPGLTREPLKRKRTRPAELTPNEATLAAQSRRSQDIFAVRPARPPMLLIDEVHRWLAEERAVTDSKARIIEKDLSQHVRSTGEVSFHAPYEKIRVVDDKNIVLDEITIDANKDVAWCGMLYGRGDKIQQHLTNCLLLGHDLRKKVKPVLLAKGVSFANVLFVTPDALEEFELKAVSWFWSIRIVALPEVSQDRLLSLGEHLCDDQLHPAHVFLKVEAFKIAAQVSVISDLDLLIVDGEKMASYLAQFIQNSDVMRMHTECGGVAVMSRVNSEVTWRTNFNPKGLRRKGAAGSSQANVSYCFGVIRPNPKLAERYMALMTRKPAREGGTLSDQDLLCEVVGNRYLEMKHNIIMFPSWFNHVNIMSERAGEILREMNWTRFTRVTSRGIEEFVSKFGAVHYSSAFNPNWAGTYEAKLKGLAAGPRGQSGNWEARGIKHDFEDYLKCFLGPLWLRLRELHGQRVGELLRQVAKVVGSSNPTPGLSRLVMTLTNMTPQDTDAVVCKRE